MNSTWCSPAVPNSSPRAPRSACFCMSCLVKTPESDNQLVRGELSKCMNCSDWHAPYTVFITKILPNIPILPEQGKSKVYLSSEQSHTTHQTKLTEKVWSGTKYIGLWQVIMDQLFERMCVQGRWLWMAIARRVGHSLSVLSGSIYNFQRSHIAPLTMLQINFHSLLWSYYQG